MILELQKHLSSFTECLVMDNHHCGQRIHSIFGQVVTKYDTNDVAIEVRHGLWTRYILHELQHRFSFITEL